STPPGQRCSASSDARPRPTAPRWRGSASPKTWPSARSWPSVWPAALTVERNQARTDQPIAGPVPHDGAMDDAVRNYIDAIVSEHRPRFARLHRLVLETLPDPPVVLSYGIPTYKVESRRLFVGAWKHGLSIYGWDEGQDAGFPARHPELKTSKGTIHLRPADAAGIDDAELRDLVRAALDR